MSEYGFKTITQENWRDPDPTNDVFVSILPSGIRPTTIEDRVSDILKPTLSEAVPLEVRRLYEVARGAMVYGTLFYPLYTLAAEQLGRVAEAALSHKYASLNGPKP